MLRNPFRELQDLLASPPVQVGTVLAVDDEIATIELLGGARVLARGTATVGARVFVQGGVVQGNAPTLPFEAITV